MKVVINTDSKASSTKVCVIDLSEKFVKAGHEVTHSDWDNYKNYDLILFLPQDSEVKKAKSENPKAIVGILSPKIILKRQRQEAQLADFLVVDSIEIRDVYLRYNKNILIYYMFPEIEARYKKHMNNKEKIIIGYHGNKVHLNCMVDASKALDELFNKYDIEFWAMYNIKQLGKWTINTPKKCPVKHIQWSEETYHKYLAKCDIGIAPAKTPISLWRGKLVSRVLSSFLINWPSYNKWDYLMRFKYATNPGRIYIFSQLHIPVVAEFVPSFCQVIQDSHSGYLGYSKEGWFDALEKLINSVELRDKMSKNLKEFIDKNCSPDINFENLLNFISLLKSCNREGND